jgi:hypothetical protein
MQDSHTPQRTWSTVRLLVDFILPAAALHHPQDIINLFLWILTIIGLAGGNNN